MKKIYLAILLIFIAMSCKNQQIKAHSNHILSQERLEANTLTNFLEIGYQQDTLAKSYSELKYDSIEAIDFKPKSAFVTESEFGINTDTSPKDTIVSRHLLSSKQAMYLTTTIDSKKTYENAIPANCFEPHMIFVFIGKIQLLLIIPFVLVVCAFIQL
jgi:hypothetical protein